MLRVYLVYTPATPVLARARVLRGTRSSNRARGRDQLITDARPHHLRRPAERGVVDGGSLAGKDSHTDSSTRSSGAGPSFIGVGGLLASKSLFAAPRRHARSPQKASPAPNTGNATQVSRRAEVMGRLRDANLAEARPNMELAAPVNKAGRLLTFIDDVDMTTPK